MNRLGIATPTAFALLTSLALLATACGDSGVNLDEAESVLVLSEVNGSPLPATVANGNHDVVFVADSIWLLPDDRWYRVEHTVRRAPGEEDMERMSDTEGSIDRDGSSLVLNFVCRDQPDASCPPPERLMPDGPQWVADRGGTVLRFREVIRGGSGYFGPGD